MFSFFKRKSSSYQKQPIITSMDHKNDMGSVKNIGSTSAKPSLTVLKEHRSDLNKAVNNIRSTGKDYRIMNDSFVKKYTSAARSLAESSDTSAVDTFVDVLKEQLDGYKEYICNAGNAPRDWFIKEWHWDTAIAMIDALGALGDGRAYEMLSSCLDGDIDKELREASAEALGNLNVPGCIELLKRCLSDSYPKVRVAAAASLQKLGEPKWAGLIKGNEEDFRILLNHDDGNREEFLRNLCASLDISNNNSRCNEVEDLVRNWGNTGFEVLLMALRSENKNIFDAGAWGFVSTPLEDYESELEEKLNPDDDKKGASNDPDTALKIQELNEIIREAAVCMTDIVKHSRIQNDTYKYFNHRVSRALNFLEEHGNPDSLPALETLLEKAAKKRESDGFQKTYFQTSEYGGWIDNDSPVKMVQDVISAIKDRAKIE